MEQQRVRLMRMWDLKGLREPEEDDSIAETSENIDMEGRSEQFCRQGGFPNLPIHTRHRSSCHTIRHTSKHVDVVTQQILKAPIAKLEELV